MSGERPPMSKGRGRGRIFHGDRNSPSPEPGKESNHSSTAQRENMDKQKPRTRKPEMQIYVPRGRRNLDETAKKSKDKTKSVSKSHKESKPVAITSPPKEENKSNEYVNNLDQSEAKKIKGRGRGTLQYKGENQFYPGHGPNISELGCDSLNASSKRLEEASSSLGAYNDTSRTNVFSDSAINNENISFESQNMCKSYDNENSQTYSENNCSEQLTTAASMVSQIGQEKSQQGSKKMRLDSPEYCYSDNVMSGHSDKNIHSSSVLTIQENITEERNCDLQHNSKSQRCNFSEDDYVSMSHVDSGIKDLVTLRSTLQNVSEHEHDHSSDKLEIIQNSDNDSCLRTANADEDNNIIDYVSCDNIQDTNRKVTEMHLGKEEMPLPQEVPVSAGEKINIKSSKENPDSNKLLSHYAISKQNFGLDGESTFKNGLDNQYVGVTNNFIPFSDVEMKNKYVGAKNNIYDDILVDHISSTVNETVKETPGPLCTDRDIEKTAIAAAGHDSDDNEWDKIYDEEGKCLDPDLNVISQESLDEVTAKLGKVRVKKPIIDYLNYQPNEHQMSYDDMEHVIEIFDFPVEFKTTDLLSAFKAYSSKGFDIKWVDDTHALGVFDSPVTARDALRLTHPLLKVGPLSKAAKQCQLKAKRCIDFLQPYKPRPETSATTARRLVTGALGLAPKVSKEQREAERKKLRDAKDKRRQMKKQAEDIWEGNV